MTAGMWKQATYSNSDGSETEPRRLQSAPCSQQQQQQQRDNIDLAAAHWGVGGMGERFGESYVLSSSCMYDNDDRTFLRHSCVLGVRLNGFSVHFTAQVSKGGMGGGYNNFGGGVIVERRLSDEIIAV